MTIFKKKSTIPVVEKKYGEFKPGDIDPTTGKKIIYLAYQKKNFYVSIDKDTNLNWSASENIRYTIDFGEVVSQVSLTEALVDRIFTDKTNRIAYKKF